MAATKRSQNTCNDCHYTWYPKGKNLSRECPNCKSKNVKIVGPGLGSILGGIVAIGIAIAIFGGNKKSEADVSTVVTPSENSAVSQPAEVNTATTPISAEPRRPAEVQMTPATQDPAPAVAPMTENERVVSEEELKQMKAKAAEHDQSLTSETSTSTDSNQVVLKE